MAGDKTILRQDQTRQHINTTAYWNAHPTIIPKKGEIYIYSDATVTGADGQPVATPRIKIGTGNEYLVQLPFAGQPTVERLEAHIADNDRHVNDGERDRWNSKLNIDPDPNVHCVNGTLIFNRD